MRTPPRVMPAMVTAFDRDEEIDVDAHRHNLRTLWDRGVRGFIVAGSTGEGPYLEAGERAALCSAARSELGDDAFVVCGVAAETVRAALGQIAEAAAGGADAVLVMTATSLVRGRHDLVAGHYVAIADRSGLPVLLYTVPGVTGYELPVETVVALAGHGNIVGIKDSGGRAERFARWRDQVPSPFWGFCGASGAIVDSMAFGAHGAITASANYAFDLVARTVDGDTGAQRDLAAVSGPVEAGGIAGTKAAAAGAGLRPGYSRAPLPPPTVLA